MRHQRLPVTPVVTINPRERRGAKSCGRRGKRASKRGAEEDKRAQRKLETRNANKKKKRGDPAPHEERARAGKDSAVAPQQSRSLNGSRQGISWLRRFYSHLSFGVHVNRAHPGKPGGPHYIIEIMYPLPPVAHRVRRCIISGLLCKASVRRATAIQASGVSRLCSLLPTVAKGRLLPLLSHSAGPAQAQWGVPSRQ